MKKIIWSNPALDQFANTIAYYTPFSESYANRLAERIIAYFDAISNFPYMYPSDPYRKQNDGSFRYVILDDVAISYRVTLAAVYVLRIRHSSQEPEQHG